MNQKSNSLVVWAALPHLKAFTQLWPTAASQNVECFPDPEPGPQILWLAGWEGERRRVGSQRGPAQMGWAHWVLLGSQIPCLSSWMTAVGTPRARHRLSARCGVQGTGAAFLSSAFEAPFSGRGQSLLPFLLGLQEASLWMLSISREVCEVERTLHPSPTFRIRILYLALRHLPETCVFFYLLGTHSRDSSQNCPRPPSPKVDSLQPFF